MVKGADQPEDVDTQPNQPTNELYRADIAQYRYDDKSRLYLLRSGELAVYNPPVIKEQIIDTGVLNFNNFKDDKYVYAKVSSIQDQPGTEVLLRSGQDTPKRITVISTGLQLI